MDPKFRIIVIDDEQGIRDMLSFKLGNEGYDVTTAEDGVEGIEKIKNNRYDLAILDLKMPRKDGVETLKEIKKIDPDVEVIIATGYSTIETAVTCLKLGAYDYISKPFNVDELTNLIQKALERKDLKIEIALYKTSRILFSYLSLDKLLHATIEVILGIIKADSASIMLFDSRDKLYIAGSYKLSAEIKNKTQLNIGERIAGKVVQKKEPIILNGGLDKYPEFADIPTRKEIKSSIICPLYTKTKTLGVINLTRTDIPYNFNEIDRRNISIFAFQIAQAIENASLYKQLNSKMKELEGTYKDLKSTEQQLLQSQKMEAIGTLAGGVAHDFNNLLTTILGNANLAMSEVEGKSTLYSDLKEISIAASRAANLTRQLLLFSRKHAMDFRPVNINKVINNLVTMLQSLIGEDISIDIKLEPNLLSVNADKGNIDQVITNLAVNARDAMPRGGKITIKTENVHLDKEQCKIVPESYTGKFIRLSIEDTGTGMDKKTMQHIFEPFFSTKGPGKGTGLGLSVIYGIIKQHNGWINVYSEPGRGSIFKTYLPISIGKEKKKARKRIVSEKIKGHKERVLLAEDEESVRKYAKTVLAKNGYIVSDAQNVKEALKIFEKKKGKFDLVISDMILPDKTGLELVDTLLSHKPELRVIFTSGYLDDKSQWPIIQEKGYRFVQKPFEMNELLLAARETLDKNK